MSLWIYEILFDPNILVEYKSNMSEDPIFYIFIRLIVGDYLNAEGCSS